MIDSAYIVKLIQQLSHYFETLLWAFVSLIVGSALLFLLLKVQEVSFKKILSPAFKNILGVLVAIGQIFLLVVVCLFFWVNYRYPQPALEIPQDFLADTSWVRDDLRLYFIDGNQLRSIQINGKEKQDVLVASDPIKEYHFSPDGKYLLVVTTRAIYLLDRKTHAQLEHIDSLEMIGPTAQWSGSVSGIRWSPDSRRFCYEIARWSMYAVHNSIYVYDIPTNKKRPIEALRRRLSSLYWDRSGENLYYLQTAVKDTSVHTYPFEVNVFRIPLLSLQPEFVTKIPRDQSQIPISNLRLRGIDLDFKTDEFVFRQGRTIDVFVSDEGQHLGIDKDDYLYYVPNRWFRNRLLKISREPRISDMPRHSYRGGELTIAQIRWIPGGRYVIMLHRYLGVLILEPATRKLGLLVAAQGNTFGWYVRGIDRKKRDFIPLLEESPKGSPAGESSREGTKTRH